MFGIQVTKTRLLPLLLCWLVSTLSVADDLATSTHYTQLISQLQQGGYIIYLRHGPTDLSQKDNINADPSNCQDQRNLSELGQNMLAHLGQLIRQLDIPITKVFSSPYCRCTETAKITFNQFEVIDDLRFSMSKDPQESHFLGQALKNLMLATDNHNSNTVFVGHSSNLRDGLGVWPKPEGVAVVFRKMDNNVIYQGMILPEQWQLFALAQTASQQSLSQ